MYYEMGSAISLCTRMHAGGAHEFELDPICIAIQCFLYLLHPHMIDVCRFSPYVMSTAASWVTLSKVCIISVRL